MCIDVWSDIACPWCWLGKRHLEIALERAGIEADVVFRSFELQPARRPTIPVREYLLPRFGSVARIEEAHARLAEMGARVGLAYDFGRALSANTFDAHRVHHYAKTVGRGANVMDRFFRAYQGEGADLADPETIARLAVEAGLDAEAVTRVLASDAHAEDVRADEAAAREIGVTGVPFFVFDGRFAVAGAQPVEVFERAVDAARKDA